MFATLENYIVRLLRWSERYTKTDMVYLVSGGFWSVIGQIGAALIAFFLAIAIARFVPKDAYGEYKYLLAVIAILSMFSLNNIAGAVLLSAARGFKSALSDGFWANLRWSITVFFGALAVGGYYLYQGNSTLGFGVLFGGCLSPFLSGFNLYGSFLAGIKDFRRLTWYSEIITNFIPMVSLIAISLVAPSPLPLLTTYFVSNVLAAGYVYWRSVRLYGEPDSHDPDMLSYGKHLSLMGVLNGVAGNIDQLLLFHFAGALNLAVYNFAIAIPDQAKGPLKMLDTMLQARFVARTPEEIHSSMANKVAWLFLSSILFIVAYIIFAPFLYEVFFPNYVSAIFYSQVYVLAQLALVFWPMNSYIVAQKNVRAQYLIAVLGSVFQIVAMTMGVIMAGLLGLIIARVIARLFVPAFAGLLYALDI